ncbi:MAG: hypothetical protein HC839_02395 [Leptolyngbyaceae cyanobacterium RM2_2_21]|nr:hypothetical protein [Leptolyngbyaceae cyanobacterium RM2_2_21]
MTLLRALSRPSGSPAQPMIPTSIAVGTAAASAGITTPCSRPNTHSNARPMIARRQRHEARLVAHDQLEEGRANGWDPGQLVVQPVLGQHRRVGLQDAVERVDGRSRAHHVVAREAQLDVR